MAFLGIGKKKLFGRRRNIAEDERKIKKLQKRLRVIVVRENRQKKKKRQRERNPFFVSF